MNNTRFNTFASIMIAIVSVLGAGAACLASVAANRASNADFDGLTAEIKAQEETLFNQVIVHEHFRAFLAYHRYNELGNLLYDEYLQTGSERASALGQLQREVWGLAAGLDETFFPTRYLVPEGGYDIQRELGERLAESSRNFDLNPDPHFRMADALRTKSLLFASVLIMLSVAFWFFNAAEIIESRLQYVLAAIGILVTLASLIAGLIVQFAL